MARIAPKLPRGKLPRGTNYTRFCTRINMCTRIYSNFQHCVHEMTQFAKYIYIYMCVCVFFQKMITPTLFITESSNLNHLKALSHAYRFKYSFF